MHFSGAHLAASLFLALALPRPVRRVKRRELEEALTAQLEHRRALVREVKVLRHLAPRQRTSERRRSGCDAHGKTGEAAHVVDDLGVGRARLHHDALRAAVGKEEVVHDCG